MPSEPIKQISLGDIQNWLQRQGVYNCIVIIDGMAFRVNMTTGIVLATPDDAQVFPVLPAPDWLETFINR